MIENMATNPDKYASVMQDSMKDIALHAPTAATGITGASTRALQYLQSQMPPKMEAFPIPVKTHISAVAAENFHRAIDIVEQPLHIYAHIKSGTLTPEHMKGLATVYPSLYGEMKTALIGELTNHLTKSEQLPYKTKLSMSLFLGAPLDASMTPQSIQASQTMPIQAKPQPSAAKPGKSNLGALSKMPSMAMTPLQARMNDRSGA